jgi:feruloyl esterase
MGHCSGGPGFNACGGFSQLPPISDSPRNDLVSAIERWVETGIAPERIEAARYVDNDVEKGVEATRPPCLWPQRAQYDGTGDVKEAANFDCVDQGTN